MDNEEKEYPFITECQSCFMVFETTEERKYKCDYCEIRLTMGSLELLKRKISVLEHIAVRRFPQILKHLLEHVELKE